MKTIFKLMLTFVFALFAVTPQSVSAGLSPFSLNSLDPAQGTADASDIFVEVNDLESFETKASEFIAPAWLEILVLISPANYPVSTFLTQKTMEGLKGLAKAQSAGGGKYADLLIKTDKGESRFNPKYAVNQDKMKNIDQFSEEAVNNYKLNWGQISIRPFQDTVNGAGFAGGATTGNIPVANVDMWTVKTKIKVQNHAYANSGDDCIVIITAVDASNNQVAVKSLGTNGTENIPAIAAGVRLTRMGVSGAEGDVKNDHVSISPTSDYNYVSKFITSVVYSTWMMETALFTNYSFSLVTNMALQDFRYSQEFDFMFGLRSKTPIAKAGGGTENVFSTGGLTYFVDQEIEYGAGGGDNTITETDIVDFTKAMRVGNNGSDTRYLFAGSNLIGALNKGVMNNSTRFVQKDYDTVYGLSFTVLYSFFGTINVMYAPLMDQSEYIDRGFLLDMQYIDKFVFQPFRQTKTDLVKLREYDGESIDMVEACGLIVRNKDTQFTMVLKS